MKQFVGISGLLLMAGCALQGPPAQIDPATRNVILFVGDGMGISTVTAARIYAGQLAGGTGEEHSLSFEAFPNVALVKTYNTDFQVPDSAGTMTALVTGEKTRSGLLGIAGRVKRGDCAGALKNPLPTLLELAESAGYRTGVVSTATITHATPGATYAHSVERNWENDSTMPDAAKRAGCRDIARQLIEFDHGDGIEVMLGGGRAHFRSTEQTDPEHAEQRGNRADGVDLVTHWLQRGSNHTYVWNAEQFSMLEPSAADSVLGLFEPSHMRFEADRANDPAGEPSLAEMTEFALTKLAGDAPGYFLMVEGGRIDHGHHLGNAYKALEDTLAFDAAVAKAVAMTDPANTLILVTADHSHTFTISGYPRRGNPILGTVEVAPGVPLLDLSGRPYTTLGYANGPGYRETLPDLSDIDTLDPDFRQVAGYPLAAETHAGEDVAAFAQGLGADKLGGVIEQNLIYDVLFEALFGQPPAR
ncbi:MAG: alkaline phosphatase [Gammaproteobacteria bacterium]|nr:alkaline phosphatase [Gammaproteobacteria bacterium]